MRLERKVVVGFWQDVDVLSELATWMRAAAAWHDWQGAPCAASADNMREVALTEGDKVEPKPAFRIFGHRSLTVWAIWLRLSRSLGCRIDQLVARIR